jgi:hypothetical protein
VTALAAEHAEPRPARVRPVGTGHAPGLAVRWAPFAAAVLACAVLLTIAGTSVLDLLRYAAYAVLAVGLPGTLVYRALRRTPHTFVEDVAVGLAVGLCLELAGWALFSLLHLQAWLLLWPLLVIVPFAAAPGLRRHWRVTGYRPTPVGWSWAVAGVVVFFTAYLYSVFLARNPILPTSENTRQYLDLAYQTSLAGEAKHHFPPDLPQVAGEPLYYHWFAYAHMASTSLIGHIDLPVVALRLAVPALCALAVVLSAVVGWRLSGRPAVGMVAAVLFWVVGEFNFTDPVTVPFGTQATFVIWHGMSMTYSWVLLVALIGTMAESIGGRPADHPVPALGRGGYVLTGLLLFGSSGAKASSLPVVLGALAFAGVVLLATRRRLPRSLVVTGVLAGLAQLFATAVLFHFQAYGLGFDPGANIRPYYAEVPGHPRTEVKQVVLELAVVLAFVLNMQLRQLGVVPLLWQRRLRLEPAQWMLLGGALAGPGLYLALSNIGAQYFTRAGFTFGVILSAWGYVVVLDRAGLSRRGKVLLAAAALVFSGLLVAAQFLFAGAQPQGKVYSRLVPIWQWAAVLGGAGVVMALAWRPLARALPGLRRRGGLVALTLALVAGAPGLVMDQYHAWQVPNGGPNHPVSLPKSRVDAARWARDHSRPNDVLATNVHCVKGKKKCDSREFWLSAYAERSVLVEGWGFAPRVMVASSSQFWDPQLLAFNDKAFTDPTPAILSTMHIRHHVRYLVVDRQVGQESPRLAALATQRFDNGRMAVYELR